MRCINEEKLWEYLDGEISKEEKHNIERHIEQCSHCANELNELHFFNNQFSSAVKDLKEKKSNPIKNCLVEIELGYNEIKPQLSKYWRGIIAFSSIIVLFTLAFVTLACPVSNKMIFQAEFNSVTYNISQLLYFMTKPIVMHFWVIVMTFSFLFWIDKKWLVLNKQFR